MARARRSPHRRHVGDARRRPRSRRFSTAVRSSTCRAGCIRSRSTTRRASPWPTPRRACSATTAGRRAVLSARRARDPRARSPRSRHAASARDVDVLPLHGSLDADEQDRALRPASRGAGGSSSRPTSPRRRVTVPGVTAVVDSGLHKVARYDAERAIDSLDDRAHHRGRRRSARRPRRPRWRPGVVRRLWDARDRLRPHREPEIHRVDLCGDRARRHRLGRRSATLRMVRAAARRSARRGADAARAARPSTRQAGRADRRSATQVQRLPLHPRLARMLIAGRRRARDGAGLRAALGAALPARRARRSDHVRSAVGDRRLAARAAARAARGRRADSIAVGLSGSHASCRSRRHVRIGSRRSTSGRSAAPSSPAIPIASRSGASPDRRASCLASGAGAVVAPRERRHATASFSSRSTCSRNRPHARGTEPRDLRRSVRLASRVDREWLSRPRRDVVHRVRSRRRGTVRAVARRTLRRARAGASVRSRRSGEVAAASARRRVARARPASDEERAAAAATALRRARTSTSPRSSARAAARRAIARRRAASPRAAARRRRATLDRDAPETIAVPSGRSVRLEYDDDGSVSASVKLQELFGLADTPRIGRAAKPVRARAARAERPAGADDARSAQLLGSHVSGSAKGAARPLSETSVARRSVDGARKNLAERSMPTTVEPSAFRLQPSNLPKSGCPARDA